MRGAPLHPCGHFDCDDQVAPIEHVVTLRCIAGQAMEISERDRSFSRAPAHHDRRVQGCKRHCKIGWVRSDAGLGPSEDRVIAIETVER